MQLDVNEFLVLLGAQRGAFIEDVRSSVHEYIQKKSLGECIDLVKVSSNGSRSTLPSEVSTTYLEALTYFCAGKKLNGQDLDSALTEPIVALITEKFSSLYERNSDDLARILMPALLKNQAFLVSMAETMVQISGSAIPSALRSKAIALLIHKLGGEFTSHLGSAAGRAAAVATTKAVAAAVSIPIAQQTAMLIVKFIAVHLKTVLAKVMASAAFKTMIAAAVKKFAAAAILSAIIKLVAVKLGITTTGAFFVVLLPILGAFLVYEGYHFPGKLAKQVSTKVAEDLDGNFGEINRNVMGGVVGQLLSAGFSGLSSEICAKVPIDDLVSQIGAELARSGQ